MFINALIHTDFMNQKYSLKQERLELVEILRRSDKKIYSCGCPYLALSDEIGYITAYASTHDSKLGLSNFGRISVQAMLKCGGFSDRLRQKYAQAIYEHLENGYSLHDIAEKLAGKELYRA